MLITGEWQFTRADAEAMLGEIADEYEKLFDARPAERVLINLVPFPQGGGRGDWAAETRGRTVTIVSGDTPFATQSPQRLHEQLRHELFHLWLPNGVRLTGSYDWFYEGAALYHSLKTGARVGRITFANFLETLSQAAAIDVRMPAGSLLDASAGRWRGNTTGVYARGILTAFALDVAMQDASRGKRSMDLFVRRLYAENREREADGNATILRMLGEMPETTPIAERHIKGSDRLDVAKIGVAAGIGWDGRRFTLTEKPSGRQRAILRDLGYNSERRRPRYQNEK
jgi:predicted metalloprotease with PDZ domain